MGFSLGDIGKVLGVVNPTSLIGTALSGGIEAYSAYAQNQAAKDANSANREIASQQMGFSAGQSAQQMAFQERMANSTYQRVTEDMKKAGLNPMLAIDQGGAPSPSGSMGSSAGATMLPVPPIVSNFISGAKDLINTYSMLRTAYSNWHNIDANTVKAGAETSKVLAEAKRTGADTKGLEMRNFQLQRQLDVEKGNDRLWGILDAINQRIGIAKTGLDLIPKLNLLLPMGKGVEGGPWVPGYERYGK